jgi:hypothetical protein
LNLSTAGWPPRWRGRPALQLLALGPFGRRRYLRDSRILKRLLLRLRLR